MEHTLHLASKAFIKAICPTPSSYKKKKKGSKNVGPIEGEDGNKEDEEDNEDNEIAWLAGLCDLGPARDDEEIDDVVDYEPNDLLGKVLALINQASNQTTSAGKLSADLRAPGPSFTTGWQIFHPDVPRGRATTFDIDQVD